MTGTAIRPERPIDWPAIRAVNGAAFGSDEEADLVDALRAGGLVIASLVAVADGKVVGHILFSDLDVRSDGRIIRSAALAPMAVLPAWQRGGIGSALVRAGLDACRAADIDLVVVLGHPDYYPRFGFSAELAKHLRAPFSGPALMALALTPDVLADATADVRYPDAFGIDTNKSG